MKQFLNADPPPPEIIEAALVDFGFWHELGEVYLMYAEYVNKGHYAYAGGVLEQPSEYWDDMATMRWLELWVKHVANLPRLEPVSVFETLRDTGQFEGKWLQQRKG